VPEVVFRAVLPLLWVWLIGGLAANRYWVRRRIGRDPIVVRPLRGAHGASGYLESLLSVCALIATADVVLNAVSPRWAAERIGIDLLRSSRAVGFAGLGLLGFGVLVASLAVRQMGASWRVGIDRQAPGALVASRFYARVRHPIYSGVLLATAGLAGVTGDALAVVVAVAAVVALPVQARLEEEFLLSRHPDSYPEYLRRTGRFWPALGR
jgi:protein-S-isoprenylcysteine O-methyltransferase Ste14